MQTPTTLGSPRVQIQVPPLRAVREAHGYRLRETARRAGIDAGHLSRVERGLASLSLPALLQLAKVLGLAELVAQLAPYVGAEGREAS